MLPPVFPMLAETAASGSLEKDPSFPAGEGVEEGNAPSLGI
jgi:hypothetical protein